MECHVVDSNAMDHVDKGRTEGKRQRELCGVQEDGIEVEQAKVVKSCKQDDACTPVTASPNGLDGPNTC